MDWRCGSSDRHMLCMWKTLNSNPSPTQKKKISPLSPVEVGWGSQVHSGTSADAWCLLAQELGGLAGKEGRPYMGSCS
jgi:hypothetical protein